jgi:hypothetical protein
VPVSTILLRGVTTASLREAAEAGFAAEAGVFGSNATTFETGVSNRGAAAGAGAAFTADVFTSVSFASDALGEGIAFVGAFPALFAATLAAGRAVFGAALTVEAGFFAGAFAPALFF